MFKYLLCSVFCLGTMNAMDPLQITNAAFSLPQKKMTLTENNVQDFLRSSLHQPYPSL